ncbi:MAG: DUF732 domain-containing protein [Pseudonocardiaceae bacterium]
MRLSLALIAAVGLLAGCGGGSQAAPLAPARLPTIPSEAFNNAPSQVAIAVDVVFLSQLNGSGVPYSTNGSAITEAHVVCATLTENPAATQAQVAALEPFGSHNQAFVDAAITAYCPEFEHRS